MRSPICSLPVLLLLLIIAQSCTSEPEPLVEVKKGHHIVLIGNNLGSRMMNYGFFETAVHSRFPDSLLFIRNMCDGGNTAGFRPHSGRESPWAFPGAEQFNAEVARNSGSRGHFWEPDEWLSELKADLIIGFFGFNESFRAGAGVEDFKNELSAFIDHTRSKEYNGRSSPGLVLVSPIAFEDLTAQGDLPDGKEENRWLKIYTDAMREICEQSQVPFVDVFSASRDWMSGPEPLTIDGSQLNEAGYEKLSAYLAGRLFGGSGERQNNEDLREAVLDKNWYWHNDFKIPNGVHVFGRRYEPFGPDNYPYELVKIRQMTANRDTAIWRLLAGDPYDLEAADENTLELPEVYSNYTLNEDDEEPRYLYGDDALASITVPEGYEIDLFASEREFPELANPVQVSFDNKGRLWVAVMPSYPHYRPGDERPNDKLLILEDTDGDGKADKETIFADGLHLPIGFEFAPEGVYVSQGTNLVLLRDTDGDDRADVKEILLSGFDDHDTHHAISAFSADPSGAIYMAEGVFLHTNVETSYGPVRATNGGFFRYDPVRHKLERTAQLQIPNPWGIAFDDWGQNFFAETSGPDIRWMLPGSVSPLYGVANHKSKALLEGPHRVRPTSGLEFVSSRHFPEDVQGDLLINNNIGFLGTKQHRTLEEGTGFRLEHRQDLVSSTDGNFRPVDMEFAPDGSLYLADWHNILIGHMQHNARDPFRDHVHGRIYRITYPSQPLVEPAEVSGAAITVLLDNLKLPEYRTRYRSRRELRGRDVDEVLTGLDAWIGTLDPEDPMYEKYMLEGLWVSWGLNKLHNPLLLKLLEADDPRIRAAAVRVVRYNGHQLPEQVDLLSRAVTDASGRVRMEAIAAASWLDEPYALHILGSAADQPMDDWVRPVYETAWAHVRGMSVKESEEKQMAETALTGNELEKFKLGMEIYNREGYCVTCHQADGNGLPSSGFPPLTDTDWVNGDDEVLIKITLNGLLGPITVSGKEYPGQVPMTPFKGLLDDREIAAVLTYVRNAFGNTAQPVSEEKVREVRAATDDFNGFYAPSDLLK